MTESSTHVITLEQYVARGTYKTCLGVDLGKKFTGIAISNPENTLAVPLDVLSTCAYRRLAAKIFDIMKHNCATWVVLGLPLNLDGSWTKGCDLVSEFASYLAPYPVCLWDERLSTRSVQYMMPGPVEKIDAHAATIILQHALDRLVSLKMHETLELLNEQ